MIIENPLSEKFGSIDIRIPENFSEKTEITFGSRNASRLADDKATT
jgi:hypothetical protein